jgi:glutathione S-transferase
MASQYSPLIPHLHSITVSHYCEKVRWALTRLQISYSEENHLPGFHMLANFKRGGSRTVPCLFTQEGTIPDSTDILHWLDKQVAPPLRLFPNGADREEVAALEQRFDLQLGPHTRRFIYFYLLQQPSLAQELLSQKGPANERRLLPLLWPGLTVMMRKSMNITEAASQRSLAKITAEFDFADQLLSDGRAYFCGNRFSAADLTFAALAAPVLAPAEYSVALPDINLLPDALKEQIVQFRKRPSGQKALEWFREEYKPVAKRTP